MTAPHAAPRNRFGRARRPLAFATAAAALALTAAGFGSASSSASPRAHAAATLKGLYGSLPPAGTPTKGGTITFGQLTGSTPAYILPILPSAQASIYTIDFIQNQFLPLYNGPVGGVPEINYALSLAPAPTFSNGDKTVTIHLKPGFKWSNGQPVTADDVLFDIDLIEQAVKENPSNWSAFTPGYFPQSVSSVTEPNKSTIVINLKRSWNPSYFLNDQLQGAVFPMPSSAWNIAKTGGPHLNWRIPANAKAIYDYLGKQGASVATFGTNPLWKIADGPFVMSSFNPTNSSYVWKANPNYGGSPKPAFAQLSVETYTGITPEINALKTGALDISQIDFSQLPQVPSIRAAGYSVYGYGELGWFAALFNFKDATNHFNSIISQLYVRQALAHLVNQPAYVAGIFKGAGQVSYGPVPSIPPTPFTPADAVNTPYPFNPATAVSILKSHGWNVVPGGQTTCAKAGTGAGECGAGIPAGTPFKFTWFDIPASETPSSGLESDAFASEAKTAAGINVQIETKTFNFIIATYNDANPADAKYTNDWGVLNFGGFTDSYYPTTSSIFNTTGVYNTGAYNSPMANTLINNSVYGSDPKAVTKEASFLTQDLPGLFMPNGDYIFAVSKKVGGPADGFMSLTQQVDQPQYWYLTK
jgi:peptide/nickel transport system substrate-binding protein